MKFYNIKFNKNLIEPEEDKQILIYLSDSVWPGPEKFYWVLFYHKNDHCFYNDGKKKFHLAEIGGWIYMDQIVPNF